MHLAWFPYAWRMVCAAGCNSCFLAHKLSCRQLGGCFISRLFSCHGACWPHGTDQLISGNVSRKPLSRQKCGLLILSPRGTGELISGNVSRKPLCRQKCGLLILSPRGTGQLIGQHEASPADVKYSTLLPQNCLQHASMSRRLRPGGNS